MSKKSKVILDHTMRELTVTPNGSYVTPTDMRTNLLENIRRAALKNAKNSYTLLRNMNKALNRAAKTVGLSLGAAAALPAFLSYTPALGSTLAPGSSFWMNPITKQMATGTAMSEGVNLANKAVNGYNSVGEGVGDLVQRTTGWNPNNTWLGPMFTESLNPGWYVNPNRIIGNIISKITTKLYSNPLPSYKLEDILASNFYKLLVKDYGENLASQVAKIISSPEFLKYFLSSKPSTILKSNQRHLSLMNTVDLILSLGGLLSGSGRLAQEGTVHRTGLLHDLDFNVPGNMTEGTTPVLESLTGWSPLVSRRPISVTVEKPHLIRRSEYITYPIEKDGYSIDLFIKDRMPTKEEIPQTILDAKKLFNRAKDLRDLSSFKPYSAENPMIDVNTGTGQWNPTLFRNGFLTREGYPQIILVETYPGSGVKVPVVMNNQGQIRTIPVKALRITPENAASITPEQWTAAQDAAIARGDMAEAQRLRDLHFKIKNPENSEKVFSHATPYDTPDFNVFDLSRTGQNYIQSKRFGKNVAYFSEEPDPTGNFPNWRFWGEKYRLFKLGSKGSQQLRFPRTEVIVDDPNQIKLADAITYDDNGVRIPLGLRDNFSNPDIRYYKSPNKEAMKGVNYIEQTPSATSLDAEQQLAQRLESYIPRVGENGLVEYKHLNSSDVINIPEIAIDKQIQRYIDSGMTRKDAIEYLREQFGYGAMTQNGKTFLLPEKYMITNPEYMKAHDAVHRVLSFDNSFNIPGAEGLNPNEAVAMISGEIKPALGVQANEPLTEKMLDKWLKITDDKITGRYGFSSKIKDKKKFLEWVNKVAPVMLPWFLGGSATATLNNKSNK